MDPIADLESVLVAVNQARDAAGDLEACDLLVWAGRALLAADFATHREAELRDGLDSFRPPESPDAARVAVAALSGAMDVALGAHRRLAVYGTLAPGRENHHVIAPAGGTWHEVELQGTLGSWGPYPVFEWESRGEPIAAHLLESDALPSFWPTLDAFETDRYVWHIVPFTAGDTVGVTNCYVDGGDRR